MLQRFVRFVGFYGRALRTKLLRFVSPLSNVEFSFLAGSESLRVSFFPCRKCSSRTSEFAIEFSDALGSGFEFSAECCDFLIRLLQLQQERNGGMHRESLARKEAKAKSDAKKATEKGAINDALTIYNKKCR